MTPATARRSAAVTGAAGGIGHAIALRLAQDGFDMTVSDVPSAREALDALATEIEALGRRGLAGVADVMVANAGVAITAPLLETTAEQWEPRCRSTYAVSSTATTRRPGRWSPRGEAAG